MATCQNIKVGMMRFLALLMLLLAFSGIVRADENPLQPYADCLTPRIADLDDGVSDARTIGSILVGACQKEFNAGTSTITAGMNPVQLRMFNEQAKQLQADIATASVLRIRAAQKKKAAALQ